MQNITIIIPTLSNKKGLERLLKYFSTKTYPLIIIDNNPKIKKNIPKDKKNITYLPQKKNLGFAKAINLGIRKAKTEWILILNDDINFEVKSAKLKITKDPIKELLEFAKKYKLDAVSPVLINPKGKIENVGYEVLPFGKVKLIKDIKIWNQVIENYEISGVWNLEFGNFRIDGLTAACLLIKRKVFSETGGFDERFFAYLEDVDLFLSLKEKGYKFAVCPYIAVLHEHMTTGKRLGWKKSWLDFKNWILIILKHPKHFKISPNNLNCQNLLKLITERLKNFWGIIKSL